MYLSVLMKDYTHVEPIESHELEWMVQDLMAQILHHSTPLAPHHYVSQHN